jgi:hypothetical protein
MWENVLVQVRRENDMYCITHLLQNPSHKDTVSFAAGQTVGILHKHNTVDEYLNSDQAEVGVPSFINLIIDEPMEYTENRQQVEELPAGHQLRPPTEEESVRAACGDAGKSEVD